MQAQYQFKYLVDAPLKSRVGASGIVYRCKVKLDRFTRYTIVIYHNDNETKLSIYENLTILIDRVEAGTLHQALITADKHIAHCVSLKETST